MHSLHQGCQAVRCGQGAGHLPFSVIRGHKLSLWAILDAWEKDHGAGIAEPRGISGAPLSFVLQQNASHQLQIVTDVAKPSSTGNREIVLTSLPSPVSGPCSLPADLGEQQGLSRCLEWELEHSCHA